MCVDPGVGGSIIYQISDVKIVTGNVCVAGERDRLLAAELVERVTTHTKKSA